MWTCVVVARRQDPFSRLEDSGPDRRNRNHAQGVGPSVSGNFGIARSSQANVAHVGRNVAAIPNYICGCSRQTGIDKKVMHGSTRKQMEALLAEFTAGKGDAGVNILDRDSVIVHDRFTCVAARKCVKDNDHRRPRTANNRLSMANPVVYRDGLVHRERSPKALEPGAHSIQELFYHLIALPSNRESLQKQSMGSPKNSPQNLQNRVHK